MTNFFKKKIISYHLYPYKGKININTKKINNLYDLSLAYTPGVSLTCKKIFFKKNKVNKYTNKSNLVAIITNGTSILGLGNLGPLASKPVMEGKSMLFKKFANIDAYDLEINEINPNKIIDIIYSLEPTFGAINLEDIKSPDCFIISKKLKKKLKIPFFHDDQDGTAIVVTAAVINALLFVNKKIENIKLIVSGAGAASLSCIKMLISIGLNRKNIIICDSKGVINVNRKDIISKFKLKYAINDSKIFLLSQAIKDADIFLGCSVSNILTINMINTMSNNPIILALSNPNPELNIKYIKLLRKDAILFTGRSDLCNQVNNLLCFPFIFRAVLDSKSNKINIFMKKAASYALANLVRKEKKDLIFPNYKNKFNLTFNKNYLIPNIFDPNLLIEVVPYIIKAAILSKVSIYKNIKQFNFYKYYNKLIKFIIYSRK